MALNMIYKELYQQVGHSNNNGNEFPGIALILSGKNTIKLNKTIGLKKTADSCLLAMDNKNHVLICLQNR